MRSKGQEVHDVAEQSIVIDRRQSLDDGKRCASLRRRNIGNNNPLYAGLRS